MKFYRNYIYAVAGVWIFAAIVFVLWKSPARIENTFVESNRRTLPESVSKPTGSDDITSPKIPPSSKAVAGEKVRSELLDNDAPSEAVQAKNTAEETRATYPQTSLGGQLENAGPLLPLREALKLLDANLDSRARVIHAPESDFTNIRSGDEFFAIEKETGRLGRYEYRGKEEKVEPSRPLAKEDALQKANTLLFALGIGPFEEEESSIGYEPTQAQWVLTHFPTINGISGGGSLQVIVSAMTGKIVRFGYTPQKVPANMDVGIESADAIKIARRTMGWNESAAPVFGSRLSIVYPNNAFDRDEDIVFEISKETRLCWVVAFPTSDPDRCSVVFVDAATGEVSGGVTQ